MKHYIFLFTALLFFSCSEQAKVASDNKSANQVEKKSSAKPQKTKKNTGTKDAITLTAATTKIQKGSEGCVDIKVKDFVDIVSMQYSLNWNPKELKFTELQGFNLKDLTTSNFGVQAANVGKMTLSWYDQDVKGITIPDESTIYKVCFQALAEKGKKAKIMITEDPIVVEITAANAKFLKFFSEPGIVFID